LIQLLIDFLLSLLSYGMKFSV